MEQRELRLLLELCKPYFLLTLFQLCLAILMSLTQLLTSKGISALILIVYENIVATVVISALAFFLEKEKRPPLSFKILCYGFLLGLLQVTLSQMVLAVSLQLVGSTFESVAMNLQTAIVFVLALIFRQEQVSFQRFNGQAKIFGVVISVVGALAMMLWKGPAITKSTFLDSSTQASTGTTIGNIMVIVAVFSTCFWNILVGHVVRIYPAEQSLNAIMMFFGTIQTAILATMISSSSWALKWEGGLVVFTIFFGSHPSVMMTIGEITSPSVKEKYSVQGIMVIGLSFYAMTCCIHKKGPVFTSAFNPLLIVFSFLLETIVHKSPAYWGSIVGAVVVVSGLYLILWAKAREAETEEMEDRPISSPLIQS